VSQPSKNKTDQLTQMDETCYCPEEGKPLPSIDRITSYMLRLFSVFPSPSLKRLILKRLKFPHGIEFQPGFRCTTGNIKFSGTAALGDTLFIDYAPVYLGNNVGFSFRNIVITSTHQNGNFSKIITKPIVIEDNVWITSNVTILAGVTIGMNSVIGAGSVVTKDIPPNCFAAGNPCQKIRNL
jgi:maltose O-acetyltransferase